MYFDHMFICRAYYECFDRHYIIYKMSIKLQKKYIIQIHIILVVRSPVILFILYFVYLVGGGRGRVGWQNVCTCLY